MGFTGRDFSLRIFRRPKFTFPFSRESRFASSSRFLNRQFAPKPAQNLDAKSTDFNLVNSESETQFEDFFRYTSGRWLWDEDKQLRDRYKVFNVHELKQVAARVVGSQTCVSMNKLAEGGYNKVFHLSMDDGKTVLARIPNPNAGPSFYTTASEVATMALARSILKIPVPRVYDWCATADNPVGSEYIIMEEASGTQLAHVWDELTPASKLNIMNQVVSIENKLLSCSFSHYGSVYFASDSIDNAVPACITSDLPLDIKEEVARSFSIGPSVDRGFWDDERSTMDISRGPWSCSEDYALSVGHRELQWIKNHAVPKAADDPLLVSTAQNSPEAHLQLLKQYLKVAPRLLDLDSQLTRSTLWHPDLHSSNILVKGDCITAVIDWQGTWTGPLFLQAKPSKFLTYEGEILLKRPDNFDSLDDKSKSQIKRQMSRSILSQLYLMETRSRNPNLAQAFQLAYGKIRRLPVEYAGNTWDDDIVPFRESLINVERHWKDLGIKGDCPFHFTEAEIKAHLQDADGWNEVQDFFERIEGFVQRDGWTANETYEEARDLFSPLRKVGLLDLKGKERESFEKETRWAVR